MTWTSAEARTGVETVAALFVEFASAVVLVTCALFASVVPARPGPTVTTSVTVCVAPFAIVPSEHVSCADATVHVGLPGVEETKVVPAGSWSVSTTFCAGSSPPFVTTRDYVTWPPVCAVAGVPLAASPRSAPGGTTPKVMVPRDGRSLMSPS